MKYSHNLQLTQQDAFIRHTHQSLKPKGS